MKVQSAMVKVANAQFKKDKISTTKNSDGEDNGRANRNSLKENKAKKE